MTLFLLLLSLPCIFVPPGAENATALKDAGVAAVCTLSAEEFGKREAVTPPGITPRPGLASPTRVPWVNANGWRFRRNPTGKFAYDVPAGRGPPAIAEAFAYGADAAVKIDPADTADVARMLAFLGKVPPAPDLKDIADLAVVDNGTPITGEVMNLLERRNLLFEIVKKPSPKYPVNVAVGTKEYPEAEAAEPSAFALKIRHQLTDDRRTLRIYGSEVVVARLTGDGQHVRLHLLNYSGRELQGLRIRLRGAYREGQTLISNADAPVKLTDFTTSNGATEFSVPALGTYAVIDLTPMSPEK
jgi:hypothetical protein